MAALRVEIPEVVLSGGSPVVGASVQVNFRGAGAATVFLAETGGTTVANPIATDANGRIEGWLEEGSYDLVISAVGFTTYTQYFEAVRGNNSPGKLLTATGDILYASSANNSARLGLGTADQALVVASGLPAWGNVKPSALAQEGATDGQVMMWSSASGKWVPAVTRVGAELAYNQSAVAVACTATTEATGQTLVGSSSFAVDGLTPVLVEFWACSYATNQTAQTGRISLILDGTGIGTTGFPLTNSSIEYAPPYVAIRVTPAAGSHTVTAKGWVTAGTMTVNAGAGGANTFSPMFIRVTRVS